MLNVVAPAKAGYPVAFRSYLKQKTSRINFCQKQKNTQKSFKGFVKCEDERHDMTKINTEFVLDIRDAPLAGMGTGLNRPLDGSTMAVQFWERAGCAAFGLT